MFKLLFPVVVAITLTAILPEAAYAQSECTVKCQCFSSGCGCQSSGGNGCKCNADGGGCFVTECGHESCNITEENAIVIGFAPDGTPVRSTRAAAHQLSLINVLGPAKSNGARVFRGWEKIRSGHAVQRDCEGLVLRRAFSSTSIADVRGATTRITL